MIRHCLFKIMTTKLTQRQLRNLIKEELDKSPGDPLHALDEALLTFEEVLKDLTDFVESLPDGKAKQNLHDLVSGLGMPVYKPIKSAVDALNNHYEVTKKG